MTTRIVTVLAGLALLASCVLFSLPVSPYPYTEVTETPFVSSALWGPANTIAVSPAVDPNTELYINAMVAEHTRDPGSSTKFELLLIAESGSVPIFVADPDSPRVSVPITTAGYGARGVTGVPVPQYALPDSATDGHIVIIDPGAGIEFDFWQFRKERGRWVSSAAALIDYTSHDVHSGRFSVAASGFPLSAGLIWPDELLTGPINHPLVFGYPLTRDHAFVAPATRSDGWSADPAALPMGARIQLNPALDLNSLDPSLTAVEMKIAQALQTYGAYLYDTGSPGSIIELNAVNPRSFASDPYAGLPGYDQAGGYIDVGNIPVDEFRVLELGTIQIWGQNYPETVAFEERYYGVE